jgi:hypothetical protein
MKKLVTTLALAAAMGGLALTPSISEAAPGQGKGKAKGHGKSDKHSSKSHWNPAPPKKNGRHDNRDWNKGRDDDWRKRDDDWRRREEERRRWEEQRRREEYLRSQDANRNGSWADREYDRRQRTKNEWRNLAIASGAVAILGLLQKDQTLFFAGTAGALYSAYRYEQDRKSQNQLNRARAYYFSQPYFYRDGTRYDRREVWRDGERYFQFVRR